MGTPAPTSLELLATANPRAFLEAFLDGVELERNANDRKSIGATLDSYSFKRGQHNKDGFSIACKVREGGGEGEGESVYRVYAVVKDGVEIAYFATNGYYASDYGTDWDDEFTLVYPRQVVVTQYFTTKE